MGKKKTGTKVQIYLVDQFGKHRYYTSTMLPSRTGMKHLVVDQYLKHFGDGKIHTLDNILKQKKHQIYLNRGIDIRGNIIARKLYLSYNHFDVNGKITTK